MLYLGIDQHRKQLTVNVRNEEGTTLLRRQVSTQWERVRAFLAEVRHGSRVAGRIRGDRGGLRLQRLAAEAAGRVRLPRDRAGPAARSGPRKTDRRDANALGELLWVNRQRLLAGKTGARASAASRCRTEQDAEDRQLTALAPAAGPAPHADDQQGQAPLAEAQPGAGVSDQGDRHEEGEQVAGGTVA